MRHLLLTIPGHPHHIGCVLYDTRREMWDAINKGSDFLGFYESKFAGIYRPSVMGVVHLSRDFCHSGVVAHELLHAVLDVGFALNSTRDEDGNDNVSDTEALCNMMEDLTTQFWDWHYELEDEDISDNQREVVNAS